MQTYSLSEAEVKIHKKRIELPARNKGSFASEATTVLRYGEFVGSTVEVFEKLDRAMDHGRRYIDSTEKDGRSVHSGKIILANQLTSSKGRFTRTWHAPIGGVWGCLVHANALLPKSTLLLSLAVGVAACEAIREFGGDGAVLRWVNDVLLNDKKIAGFLIESHTGPRWKEQYHLIGFGININNTKFPCDLKDTATSLCLENNGTIDIKEFVLCFISKLSWNIGMLYFQEGEKTAWLDGEITVHPILERWKELSDTIGRKVIFGYDVIEKPQYSAYVKGITPDGGLKMVLDDGLEISEHSGEVRYL